MIVVFTLRVLYCVCAFGGLCIMHPFQPCPYAQTITYLLFISFAIPITYTKMSSAAARANKATMAEIKLRRLMEHNHRLGEELARPRVMVSIASLK